MWRGYRPKIGLKGAGAHTTRSCIEAPSPACSSDAVFGPHRLPLLCFRFCYARFLLVCAGHDAYVASGQGAARDAAIAVSQQPGSADHQTGSGPLPHISDHLICLWVVSPTIQTWDAMALLPVGFHAGCIGWTCASMPHPTAFSVLGQPAEAHLLAVRVERQGTRGSAPRPCLLLPGTSLLVPVCRSFHRHAHVTSSTLALAFRSGAT